VKVAGLIAVVLGDRVCVWALPGTHRSRSDTCQSVLADTEIEGIHALEDTEIVGIHSVILVAVDTVQQEGHHRSILVAPSTAASDPCWDLSATARYHFGWCGVQVPAPDICYSQ